jgi:hypothetical protein
MSGPTLGANPRSRREPPLKLRRLLAPLAATAVLGSLAVASSATAGTVNGWTTSNYGAHQAARDGKRIGNKLLARNSAAFRILKVTSCPVVSVSYGNNKTFRCKVLLDDFSWDHITVKAYFSGQYKGFVLVSP